MFKLITAFFACSENKPRLERASEADGGGDKRVEPEIFQDEAGKELLRFKRITEEALGLVKTGHKTLERRIVTESGPKGPIRAPGPGLAIKMRATGFEFSNGVCALRDIP